MSQHPFQPSSQIALICAECGKGRTHPNHAGQGEIDPEIREENIAREQEARQQAPHVDVRYAESDQAGGYGPIQSLPMPDNYFRVESNGTATQIEISIPDCPKEVVLMALLEFMERVGPSKPVADAPPAVTTKKKR